MTEDLQRLSDRALTAFPKVAPDIIEWAEENVQFPSSARSKHFNVSITPWLLEPLRHGIDIKTRIITLMKPVQSGGSVFGEVLILYWIMFWRGFLQYNWSDDGRANDRWASRVKSVFEACFPVWQRMQSLIVGKGEIDFGNVFFRNQGAFVTTNLDSDSIPLQVNEEIHSWKPGHLKKARNRSTAVWNFKSVDISNAGSAGDQLDQAFRDGTMQRWQVKCPGCGKFHLMRTKWEDRHPELGGLRYDGDAGRIGKYNYDYNKIRPTIRYQMPCGFEVHNEDHRTRRALSLSGKYSEPENIGAEISHRSYTYEGVSVDFIDWMILVKDKHDALRARALGDPEPWRRYKCERECIPYDPDDVPLVNVITTSKGEKKSRGGLVGEKLRLGAFDRQQGAAVKGEFPHWWGVIRDFQIVDGRLKSLLVYEGRSETDEDVIGVIDNHECLRWQVVADSGDDTVHVYSFCMKHGINAIKGGTGELYTHDGGARRIFSTERPLHKMINRPPTYEYIQLIGNDNFIPDPREPLFWLYSKSGIRERLYFLMKETEFITPEDVSDDYRHHMEAEERIEVVSPSDGSHKWQWNQLKSRNDLFVCEAYIAMQVDQSGMLLNSETKK